MHVCVQYILGENGFTTRFHLIDLTCSHVRILYLISVYIVRRGCVHMLCQLAAQQYYSMQQQKGKIQLLECYC